MASPEMICFDRDLCVYLFISQLEPNRPEPSVMEVFSFVAWLKVDDCENDTLQEIR